jgi:NADPH-dependent curcumin reductase CurA
LGAEAAGTVAALGPGVDNIEVGQAVAVTGAGYTEYAIAKAALCFPVQEPSAEAVAVSLSGLTAACALLVTGELKQGETVLVTAAAGGTGHFGVQVAKLKGCTVVATCGSEAKAKLLKELGADRVINYHEENVADVLKREFPQGIDLAYEGVGGALLDAVLDNLAPRGRVLSVGYISSYPHNHQAAQNGDAEPGCRQRSVDGWDLPPPEEMFWKGQEVRRGEQVIYGSVWPKDRQKIQETKKWLFDQFYDGKIKACIDPKPYHGLESVPAATDYMLSGQSIGKVVVSL